MLTRYVWKAEMVADGYQVASRPFHFKMLEFIRKSAVGNGEIGLHFHGDSGNLIITAMVLFPVFFESTVLSGHLTQVFYFGAMASMLQVAIHGAPAAVGS